MKQVSCLKCIIKKNYRFYIGHLIFILLNKNCAKSNSILYFSSQIINITKKCSHVSVFVNNFIKVYFFLL